MKEKRKKTRQQLDKRSSILVVDDDQSTRKTLSLIFKRKGYEIETAGTGQEAIERAQTRFFNLALLDIKLPDMEGVELLAPLKGLHPEIEIIMVTAHASLETAISALNRGASLYITKPLNMDEVLSTIKEVLEKQRLAMKNKRLLKELKRELAERKLAEKKLEKYRDQLEEMVKERTTKLAETNEELQREIAEKELLLKEIHHRVKSNMQLISSMLGVQNSQIKDESARKVFREGWGRIRFMALVHEKLYQSDDFTGINFAEFTNSLLNDLFGTYNVDPDTINLNIGIKNVRIDINLAIPCGLIINELVSNSLKYGFQEQEKGEIIIEFESKNSIYELTVGDNGTGFPKYLDFRNVESLGLQLVRLLCKKINATIELDRSKGTRFKIVFSGGQNEGGIK
jgi:two-component sensor histidine kinase/CheY-like chemotaxis protein